MARLLLPLRPPPGELPPGHLVLAPLRSSGVLAQAGSVSAPSVLLLRMSGPPLAFRGPRQLQTATVDGTSC